ncbi:MAG: hypothetical protein IIC82_02055 [Chloroflexi bacterium]|nr:hypothetical protein [Chloroflexota bacterium]
MRDAFADELVDIAAADSRVVLLTGDIGFNVFDRFIEAFPDRFFNMGVAEANMMGVAAGLALSGKRPVVYTIIPFLTMRAYEQIRVDVCIQNLPVTIVGVGGGLAYGQLGPTHHATEDIAILRALPNMSILSPCDPKESHLATRAALEHPGPVYVRLGKNGEPPLHRRDYQFKIGVSVEMREGDDITIISTGAVTRIALAAADVLFWQGVRTCVINMHTIKPLDAEAVRRAAQRTRAMLTIEEHNIIGGLGSAVAETLAESAAGVPFKRIGVQDAFADGVGSQEFHLERQGITVEATVRQAMTLLGVSVGRGKSPDATIGPDAVGNPVAGFASSQASNPAYKAS